MATFVLTHAHRAADCRAAWAAWNGFDSLLRHEQTVASCASGGHRVFWTVEADSSDEALNLLPYFVAERTEVSEVREVAVP